MGTFKHIGDTITIDDFRIPYNLFVILEPAYAPPKNMEMMLYKDGVLKVRANGKTNTVGSWPEGERYIMRKRDFETLLKLTKKEDSEIAKEADSLARPDECRKKEFPNFNDLVVALWEHIVEKKDASESGINDLQQKRVDVKNKYPLKKEESNGSDKVEGSVEAVLPKVSRRTRGRSKHSG